MKLFGKKKKKKEEGEEDEEEEQSKKKKKRKPRKKKKTPPKPWGRKERAILAGLFVGTIVVSATLSIRARSWKLPGLPRLSVPRIRIPFLSEEKIIIEGDRESSGVTERITKEFEYKTNDLSGVYGLYVIRLDSGTTYGVEEETVFQAASLIKLPVMAGIYMEEESGRLDLDDIYSLKEEDKVGGSGGLYQEEEGFTLTFREIVKRMGLESDNTAFNIALNILGKDRVREVIDELGMKDTSLDENETTPKDIGLFFKKLWEGKIVSEENRDELLSFLTNTVYEDHLAAGISSEVGVSHKFGREVNVVNDAGIVYSENPYVVVIMSKGVIMDEADKVFPELSSFVYREEVFIVY
jgi:beta-lactamase class A